jgi:hypothetical protein
MAPATTFRVTDNTTRDIAERHIRQLTQRLRLPSVKSCLHLSERYRRERAQWQQAIDDAQNTAEGDPR